MILFASLLLAGAVSAAPAPKIDSTLDVPPPWKIGPPGNCPEGTTPAHGFWRKPVEADVCLLGKKPRGSARKLVLRSLLSLGSKDAALAGATEKQLREKKLDHFTVYFYEVSVSSGFVNKEQDARSGWLYGAFDRGDGTHYVFTVLKPFGGTTKDQIKDELDTFDTQAQIALDGLNLMEWPKKKAKRADDEEEE